MTSTAAFRLVQSEMFSNYIFFCIVVAGFLVGLQTYPDMDTNVYIDFIDTIILYTFAAEIILKLLQEGVRY